MVNWESLIMGALMAEEDASGIGWRCSIGCSRLVLVGSCVIRLRLSALSVLALRYISGVSGAAGDFSLSIFTVTVVLRDIGVNRGVVPMPRLLHPTQYIKSVCDLNYTTEQSYVPSSHIWVYFHGNIPCTSKFDNLTQFECTDAVSGCSASKVVRESSVDLQYSH